MLVLQRAVKITVTADCDGNGKLTPADFIRAKLTTITLLTTAD